MSFSDKSIQCSDCGATFTFSASEQELFQSRGYTNEPKRCPTCPRQGSQNAMETAVTEHPARCSPQHVPSVAKKLKYPLNPAVTGRCTVVIAIEKSDRVDKLV